MVGVGRPDEAVGADREGVLGRLEVARPSRRRTPAAAGPPRRRCCAMLIECSSVPVRNRVSSPFIRCQRAMTSAPITSYRVCRPGLVVGVGDRRGQVVAVGDRAWEGDGSGDGRSAATGSYASRRSASAQWRKWRTPVTSIVAPAFVDCRDRPPRRASSRRAGRTRSRRPRGRPRRRRGTGRTRPRRRPRRAAPPRRGSRGPCRRPAARHRRATSGRSPCRSAAVADEDDRVRRDAADEAPGEVEIAHARRRSGGASCTTCHAAGSSGTVSGAVTRTAPPAVRIDAERIRRRGRASSAERRVDDEAQVRLGRQDLERGRARTPGRRRPRGRSTASAFGSRAVDRAGQRDDATERRDRVAGERRRPRLEQRRALRRAARIRVLDDHAGRAAQRPSRAPPRPTRRGRCCRRAPCPGAAAPPVANGPSAGRAPGRR